MQLLFHRRLSGMAFTISSSILMGMVELLKTFDTIVLAVSSVLTKTSIALKGYLFVEELVEYKKLAAQLNEFQKDLNYEHPVIAVFETLSVKHYENMHGEFLDVPEQ